MKPVTLYTTQMCMYCKRAKTLLAEYGMTAPTEFHVDTNPDKRNEMIERTGQRTVPQIFIGETYVGGYDELQTLHKEKTLAAMLGK